MRPLRPLLPLFAVAALLPACSGTPAAPGGPAAPASSPATPPSLPAPGTLLALGDSVAAGVGADVPATGGYVPLLAERLRTRLGCAAEPRADGCPLTVRTLAVSGATTATVLRDQVPAAVAALRGGRVRLVTLTVGGNDVFGPVLLACLDDPVAQECRSAAREAVEAADAGLDAVLGALAPALPGGTPLAVTTYYDPLPACRLAALAPVARQVLEGTDQHAGLNDVVRARAAEHGAVVVETADRVRRRADLVGGGDCLHPSGSGHAAIAAAVDEAVGPQVAAR